MKISYNWLKDYLKADITPEEMAGMLTACGLEVEGIEEFNSVRGGLKGVVVGEVKTCRKHPNADKLSITTVDIGTDKLLPIVCGAPNVAEGQKVLVATVGTTLYMGDKLFEIGKAKIRGEHSEGMICAEDELGLGTSHKGIMVLEPDVVVGSPASRYFPVYEDIILEIGLTPNRTDAMSHLGVARDLKAVLNAKGKGDFELAKPDSSQFSVDETGNPVELVVEDPERCPRFSGLTIEGIEVKDSPSWLKNYLNAVGVRPINNVVDITNFVLMEMGQPLHAYDLEKIKGKKIVVRTAREGETFITLDGEKRKLASDDLMICDAKEGMCIAGVFGGEKSGVTSTTKGLFLESAHFDPVSIRKTSRFHNLQTDASFRFERGSDPNITVVALQRAALLIKDLAGGKISSEVIDFYPSPIEDHEVRIKYAHVDRLIGIELDRDRIKRILQDLDITITEEDQAGIKLQVPPFKWDVTREADVIEEIIRIVGFDEIPMPDSLRASLSFTSWPDHDKLRNIVSDLLTANGFREIMNNSLTGMKLSEKMDNSHRDTIVTLANPLSMELNVLRHTLFFGGMETITFNRNRKTRDLKIYEFGKAYFKDDHTRNKLDVTRKYPEQERLALFLAGSRYRESWKTTDQPVDIYDLKYFVEMILKRLGLSPSTMDYDTMNEDPMEIGFVYSKDNIWVAKGGKVSLQWLEYYDIEDEVFYAEVNWDNLVKMIPQGDQEYSEIPKFPEVRRDLALLLDEKIKYSDLSNAAMKAGGKLLKRVNLFDVYKGKNIPAGKKSYALSFILQDETRTLTDKVIDKTMNNIARSFEKDLGAVIRK